jgi:hypothetical protein
VTSWRLRSACSSSIFFAGDQCCRKPRAAPSAAALALVKLLPGARSALNGALDEAAQRIDQSTGAFTNRCNLAYATVRRYLRLAMAWKNNDAAFGHATCWLSLTRRAAPAAWFRWCLLRAISTSLPRA